MLTIGLVVHGHLHLPAPPVGDGDPQRSPCRCRWSARSASCTCCGYSLDNLSLMALTIAVGFVVDDAIVMIENIVRYIEQGEQPFDAALKGAGQIGFTIISITFSLIAVFIPLLFMGGIIGRLFREFAVTVTVAVVASAFVSLTLTPVMCSLFLKRAERLHKRGRLNQMCRGRLRRGAARLRPRPATWCFRHQFPTLLSTLAADRRHRLSLRRSSPRASSPQQDTGFIFGQAEARQDISFAAMADLADRLVGDRPAGSRRFRRRRLRRLDRRQSGGEHRAHVHPAEAVRRARRLGPADHPAAAAQGRRGARARSSSCRPARTSTSAAGSAAPQYQYTLTDDQLRGAQPLGADHRGRPWPSCPSCRTSTSDQQIAAPHLAIDIDRDSRLAARPLARPDRPDALRRLRPAPGRDDLHLEQPVQGRPRGAAGVPERPGGAVDASTSPARTARRCRSAPSPTSPPRSRR